MQKKEKKKPFQIGAMTQIHKSFNGQQLPRDFP